MKNMQFTRPLLAAGAACLAFAVPATSHAAVDMFLKLDGINGESSDYKHKGDIDVLAFSWGLSKSISAGAAGAARGGKVCVQDLAVTKFVDKSSPPLVNNVVMGKPIGKGTLTVRKAGEVPVEYIVIDLTGILVSSYSTGGSGGEDRLTENVTLHFTTGKMTYTQQKPDGSPGAQAVVTFPGDGC